MDPESEIFESELRQFDLGMERQDIICDRLDRLLKARKWSWHPAQAPNRRALRRLLTVLPIELVYEIFGHTHPVDLIMLTRSNKLLRSYLMSKSSSSVWQEARKNVAGGTPSCPSDLSEPQFAHLLFMPECTASS